MVRVNVDNKTITEFLDLNKPTTAFRPTDVMLGQNGTAMYIVDWGSLAFTDPMPTTPNTGVIWKITAKASTRIQ